MRPCEGTLATFGPRSVNNTDASLRSAQLFGLSPDGRLVSTSRGLCVRRVRCGGEGAHVYDLGACDGPGYVASFEARKPAANSMDHILPLGTPARAVAAERCLTCGPYMLVERCVSRGVSDPTGSGVSNCGGKWQGVPGYTRWPATYIGAHRILGVARPDVDTVGDRLTLRDSGDEVADLAGIAATAFDGLCGSYASDGPAFDSVFVIHRVLSP